MTNSSEEFKTDLKALMEKYDVRFEIDYEKQSVFFYPVSCFVPAVVLFMNSEVEFLERVVDCIK